VPNFVSFVASTAMLGYGEKLRTHSRTQSPSLFDAPATEAVALRNKNSKWILKETAVRRHKLKWTLYGDQHEGKTCIKQQQTDTVELI